MPMCSKSTAGTGGKSSQTVADRLGQIQLKPNDGIRVPAQLDIHYLGVSIEGHTLASPDEL